MSTCTGSADSGPDSGTNDNCRWAISVPSWSAEPRRRHLLRRARPRGGQRLLLPRGRCRRHLRARPTRPGRCLHHRGRRPDPGLRGEDPGPRRDDTHGAPEPTVTRLDNADGSSWVPVPYTVDNGPGFAHFLKPLNAQVAAQLYRTPPGPLAASPGTSSVPGLKIDFEVSNGYVPLGLCPSPVYTSGVFSALALTPERPWTRTPRWTECSRVCRFPDVEGLRHRPVVTPAWSTSTVSPVRERLIVGRPGGARRAHPRRARSTSAPAKATRLIPHRPDDGDAAPDPSAERLLVGGPCSSAARGQSSPISVAS